MEPRALVIIAILGACIGSFLNVLVWRLPRNESLIWPSSHCTKCGATIRWHDNIPMISWLLLSGRCRDCDNAIPFRYPSVEALSSGLWISAVFANPFGFEQTQNSFNIASGFALASILLSLTLIDIDHMSLPEPICRWGLILGLASTSIFAINLGWNLGAPLVLNHLIAASASLLTLEWLSKLAEQLLGQPALGLGDAKLAALGGAWLGLPGIVIAMALAVATAAIFGLAGRLTGQLQARQAFPFAPFISIGIWSVWFFGFNWWWEQWLNII